MSLDSNQRSEYKARELKSVYISSKGNFLKLLIKNCHQNNINLYNQVGIVAINVMGSIVQSTAPLYNHIDSIQQQSYIPHMHQQQQQQLQLQSNNQYMQPQSQLSQNGYITIQTPQQHSRSGSGNMISGLDAATAKKLNELELAKQHAIDNEDYDEAKRLKVLTDGVKRVALQFSELEKQKQLAVQNEDYDTAKQIKIQIDQLRAQALNTSSNTPNIQYNNINTQHSYSPHQRSSAQLSPHMQSSISTANLQQSHVTYPTAPTIDDDRPIKPLNNKSNMMNNSAVSSSRAQLHTLPNHMSSQQSTLSTSNNDYDHDEEKFATSYTAPPRRADANDDRPLHKGSAANTHFTDDNINNDGYDDDSNDTPGVSESLSAGNRKDAEQLIEVYGEPICEQLYSKQWTNRVNALKHISNEISNNVQSQHLHADDKLLFMTVIKVLKRTINDNIAQVCLAGMQLLEVSMIALSSSIKSDELRMSLDGIVLLLIDKLSDANVRVRDNALHSLLVLANNKLHGLSLIPSHLLSPLKKKEFDKPLPLKSRARLLQKLLQRHQINDKANLSIQSIMSWLIPYLQHRDVNVRDSMINLAAVMANLVGTNKLEPYFKDIRTSILDTLMQRINDVNTGKITFSPIEQNRSIQNNDNLQQSTTLQPPQLSQRNNNSSIPLQQISPREFHINSNHNAEYDDDVNVRTDIEFSSPTHARQSQPHTHPHDITSDNESHNELADHLADTSLGDDSLDLSGKCQFCGIEDPTFSEERLDLHYWQDCCMLTSCKQCEQVIEISTLHEHLLHECEINGQYELCHKCQQPITVEQYAQHINSNTCQPNVPGTTKCPLCTIQLSNTEDGWKMHLLTQGCTKNTRTPQIR